MTDQEVRMKRYILPAVFAVMLFATLAFAGYGYHGHGYSHGCSGYGMTSWEMDRLDGDENGAVSFEEFSQSRMERIRSSFDSIDTNKDGVIDAAEWNELRRVHGMATGKDS
jgi:hypothetical protein